MSNICISVISNGRLTALGRACNLIRNLCNREIVISLFSTQEKSKINFPNDNIIYYQKISETPTYEDYCDIGMSKEFLWGMRTLVFYNRLLPGCIYTAMETINFHPSILPNYSGLNGYSDSIKANQLGITAHLIDSSIDGGKILRQFQISPYPAWASSDELLEQSSLLCTSAIISLVGDLIPCAPKPLKSFPSGESCIEYSISQGLL